MFQRLSGIGSVQPGPFGAGVGGLRGQGRRHRRQELRAQVQAGNVSPEQALTFRQEVGGARLAGREAVHNGQVGGGQLAEVLRPYGQNIRSMLQNFYYG